MNYLNEDSTLIPKIEKQLRPYPKTLDEIVKYLEICEVHARDLLKDINSAICSNDAAGAAAAEKKRAAVLKNVKGLTLRRGQLDTTQASSSNRQGAIGSSEVAKRPKSPDAPTDSERAGASKRARTVAPGDKPRSELLDTSVAPTSAKTLPDKTATKSKPRPKAKAWKQRPAVATPAAPPQGPPPLVAATSMDNERVDAKRACAVAPEDEPLSELSDISVAPTPAETLPNTTAAKSVAATTPPPQPPLPAGTTPPPQGSTPPVATTTPPLQNSAPPVAVTTPPPLGPPPTALPTLSHAETLPNTIAGSVAATTPPPQPPLPTATTPPQGPTPPITVTTPPQGPPPAALPTPSQGPPPVTSSLTAMLENLIKMGGEDMEDDKMEDVKTESGGSNLAEKQPGNNRPSNNNTPQDNGKKKKRATKAKAPSSTKTPHLPEIWSLLTEKKQSSIGNKGNKQLKNHLTRGTPFSNGIRSWTRRAPHFLAEAVSHSQALAASFFINNKGRTICHFHTHDRNSPNFNDPTVQDQLEKHKASPENHTAPKHLVTGMPYKPTNQAEPAHKPDFLERDESSDPLKFNPNFTLDRVLSFFPVINGVRTLHCGCVYEEALYDFVRWKNTFLVSRTTQAKEEYGRPAMCPRDRLYMFSCIDSLCGRLDIDLIFDYDQDNKPISDAIRHLKLAQTLIGKAERAISKESDGSARKDLKNAAKKAYVEIAELTVKAQQVGGHGHSLFVESEDSSSSDGSDDDE